MKQEKNNKIEDELGNISKSLASIARSLSVVSECYADQNKKRESNEMFDMRFEQIYEDCIEAGMDKDEATEKAWEIIRRESDEGKLDM